MRLHVCVGPALAAHVLMSYFYLLAEVQSSD